MDLKMCYRRFLPGLFFVLASVCCFAQANPPALRTIVPPLAGEDVARPCEYILIAPTSGAAFRAVFVVFERGRDMENFFNDPIVRLFGERHHLAMLVPRHCASQQYEDMDIDPAKGLGRALFAALAQFAEQTRHPELRDAPLVLLGFSGAGAFAGRLVSFAPERIAAAILAHAGQFEPLGLDTIQHSPSSLAVPEFILAGGRDDHVGTERAYEYFTKYWSEGAPWLFVTQNGVPHCCVVNARDLILDWLDVILKKRLNSAKPNLLPVDRNNGYDAFVQLRPTDTLDNWKLPTSSVVRATFEPAGRPSQKNDKPAGWLPSKQLAEEWKGFVSQPSHPVSSMP
jgi:dienelactone hydrolase